jgi:hypothetical protein
MFGFAGALSPYLMSASEAIFKYVEQIPSNPGRIYLDVGTREESHLQTDRARFHSLSRRYCDHIRRMYDLLIKQEVIRL